MFIFVTPPPTQHLYKIGPKYVRNEYKAPTLLPDLMLWYIFMLLCFLFLPFLSLSPFLLYPLKQSYSSFKGQFIATEYSG